VKHQLCLKACIGEANNVGKALSRLGWSRLCADTLECRTDYNTFFHIAPAQPSIVVGSFYLSNLSPKRVLNLESLSTKVLTLLIVNFYSGCAPNHEMRRQFFIVMDGELRKIS